MPKKNAKHLLPESLTTVTPFSKLVALVLFILLPFMGFYLGMKYNQLLQRTVVSERTYQK